MRFIQTCLFAMFLLVLGCQGEMTQIPGNVEVEVALGEAGLEVLSVESVGHLPNPPAGHHTISYVFEPDNGGRTVQGLVPDTRVLRTEFDRAGQPDPIEVISPIGIFDVRVPATPGLLVLRDENGETLGETRIDPRTTGLQTRSQALMRAEDVLSGPIKVVNHGDSSEKADILFLPDGYTEEQLPSFRAQVDSIVEILKQQNGYREHWTGFNVWRQDVRSRNSGTGTWGRPMDTAFETAYGVSGVERCIFFAGSAGQQAARALAIAAKADVTVVISNALQSGGCASGNFVVTARPRHIADTVAHELGHALFGLSDEYEYAGSSGTCDVGPNVSASASLSQLPWADMVTTNELPTSPNASYGTIGAFEGGGYCTRGRYRPAHNCMMRTLGAQMCKVCKREIARTMAALAPGAGAESGGSTGGSTGGGVVDSGSGSTGSGSTGGSDNPAITGDQVTITNATQSDLWVRCDSSPSPACSDWTFIEDGAYATVNSPGRRLVLHTASLPAPVTFDQFSTTAPTGSVTVYPNLQNPWASASSGGSTGGSNVGSTGTGRAPSALSPSGNQIIGAETLFTWSAVPGATSYRVEIDWEDSRGTWHPLTEFDEPYNEVELQFSDYGMYRWRVMVCEGSTCYSSGHATFYVELNSTPRPEATVDAPSAPTGQLPAHEEVVTGNVQLSWNADPAATSYNVNVRVWDDATSSWMDAAGDSTTTPSYAVDTAEAQTWHAWTVQSCAGDACSDWTEYSLFYVNN